MATARQNPLFIGPAGVPGKQGPPGPPGTPGSGSGTAATYQVHNLHTVMPSSPSANETIFVDGYSVQGDGGAGSFIWNASYTGPSTPLNVVPDGYTTGAWQRLNNNVFNPIHFGAKGDGIADDTAAIQACINAMYPAASGTLYFRATSVTGPTTYVTSAPLFLGGGAIRVEMDANTSINPASTWAGPAIFCGLPFPDPVYGTENGLTYVHISPGNYYNLAYTPINNINNWGDGSAALTTASFVVPNVLTSVTIQVNQTATGFTNSSGGGGVYVRGNGLYSCSIVDSTHLSLFYVGPYLPTDVSTGSTIPPGTPVSHISSSGYTGPTPGFTFECFIDPIADYTNGAISAVASSAGSIGSGGSTEAFAVFLYNDQVSNQTRINFQLNTSVSGVTLLQSGTHTLPAGSMTHVACTYDGVSTMSLYVAGVRAATATVTGKILQAWNELLCIGLLNEGYPGAEPVYSALDTKIAGIAFSPIARYAGASFTPPTTVQTPIGRLNCSIIDFASANRPNITGPGGVNYATGWVLAHCPNDEAGVSGVPCWLQGPGGGLDYCNMPIITNLTIEMGGHIGDGIYTWSALDGIFDNVYVNGGTRGITLDGYSYRNRLSNCSCNQSYGGNNDAGINQYSWNFGILSGSQYAILDGGYGQGGAWNIVTDVFAGISIRSFWLETTGIGGIGLFGDGSPAATIHDVFFQSDVGNSNLNNSVCALYIHAVENVIVEGGYLGANFSNPTPQLIVDSCTNVVLNGCWMVDNPGYPALTNQSIISMKNQLLPVFVNTSQAFVPYTIPGVYTTFHVVNGSSAVTASNTTVLATPGNYCQFNSQPNTTYVIETVDPSTGNLVLNLPYSGATTTAAVLTTLGYPWMPEDGSSGQGPLYINAQEQFGINTVNMIASTGMTLLINDFLWANIRMTDVNTLLSGTVKVTLPLIAGYSRSFINSTTQTLTFGGATGGTVNITSGSHGKLICDGTNWFST